MSWSALGDTSNDVSTIAASGALSFLVALLIVSAVAAHTAHRRVQRFERSTIGWFAGFASLALIVAVTLFREGLPVEFHPLSVFDWTSEGLRRLSRDPLRSSEFVLNIALFVPAGMAWTWITRRPGHALVALVLTSLGIETLQAVTGAGVNDVADLVSNTVGAAIGVAVMASVLAATGQRDAPMSRRAQVWTAAVILVIVGLLVPAWLVGASSRQNSVEAELRAQFEGLTRSDLVRMMETDSNAVFGALDDYSDGTRYSDDAIEIRYPATFFSLHRCVYVVWTDTGVEFRKASGSDCTDFIDG